ncbi:hypothetical protein HNQ56_002671 [Anaerotaenia torta]|uniref:hypothetical protein n=1 Tax=Anaerotaenia torta TaxID=433293 RepID=UPI003D1F1665
MKKRLALLCLFFLIFCVFSACEKKEVNHQDIDHIAKIDSDDNTPFDEEKKGEIFNEDSIYNLKEDEIPQYLKLDDTIVSILYNTNGNSKINRTLSIFGKVLTSDKSDKIKDALTSRFLKISLFSDERIICEATDYHVKTLDINGLCTFELVLDVEKLLCDEENIRINSVKFEQSENSSFVLNTAFYYITQYNELENNVKIIDCPISFMQPIQENSSFAVAYTFLTANPRFNDSYDINIELPKGLEDYLEIKSVEYYEDNKMKEDVNEILKYDMTLQQKKDLKVFTINVVFYKKSFHSPMYLQPVINLNIIGDYQKIGPYVPMIV